MHFGFSYIGLIWLLMLTVPNVIWTKNQPKDYDKYAANENKLLLIFERTGQVIVTTAALIFSDHNFKGWNFWASVLIVSFILMVLYEIHWIKYFRSSKTMEDFYRSIVGIPLAGATLPVIAFFLLGIYGGNIIMTAGAIILGIGHIGIHHQHKKEVTGSKPKRHIAVRVITMIVKVIFIILAAAIFGFLITAIAGRNCNQIKSAVKYKDGIFEQTYVELNGQEQQINIFGQSLDNPIIISLHGGPSGATGYFEYCYADFLTDEYTYVTWDQRGCGKTYYRNIKADPDNKTLSFDQQIEDLDALVDYICNRFGKQKVILMGHSYGTILGSRYVQMHPEKVEAYIGIGQVVIMKDWYGEVYSYEDALAKARAKGDDTTGLENAYNAFCNDPSINNVVALRSAVWPYHPMTVTADQVTKAAIFSPYAGIGDARWYLLSMNLSGKSVYDNLRKPLMDYMLTFDANEFDKTYEVPVYFISGSADWVCPVGLIREYMDSIVAPDKGIYIIEGCGHNPQTQLPEEFASAVKGFLNNTAK